VEKSDSDGALSVPDVIGFVKSQLAGYKAPRHVLIVDSIGRAANGKVDYKVLRQLAIDELGV